MNRESLNITMTTALRTARVRERLDTIAAHTGLAPTQVAGRALSVGLGLIESDLRLIFPGQSPTSAAIPCAIPTSAAQPSIAPQQSAQPCAAAHSTDAQRTAASTTAQPDTAKLRMVPTEDAARALGYRAPAALLMHAQRHPELLEHSTKQGRTRLWNLADLRATYAHNGWEPR